MKETKSDIKARLQREILPLTGYRSPAAGSEHHPDPVSSMGLQTIMESFPGKRFPTGAIHEFCCGDLEEAAASNGFISGIVGALMLKEGTIMWIGDSGEIYPPALKLYGVEPDRVVFVNLKKPTDQLWATEEGLKCQGLTAVISEVRDLSFMVSRRLQLAVEQSGVTGFLLRNNRASLNTTTSMARWRVRPIASQPADGLPGVGHARWNVSLLKVRNGQPGSWDLSWEAGRFVTDQGSDQRMELRTLNKFSRTGTDG